jgi:hypothetical protein
VARVLGSKLVVAADGVSDYILVRDGEYRISFKVADGSAWAGTLDVETVDYDEVDSVELHAQWIPVTVCANDLTTPLTIDRNCVMPIVGPGFFRFNAAGIVDPVTIRVTGSGNRVASARAVR